MRTLHASRADLWVALSDRHVYYVLSALERRGLVTVSEERPGNAPPRKVYAITEDGREALRRLLQADGLVGSMPWSDFDSIVGILGFTRELDEPAREDVLRRRLAVLDARLADDYADGRGEWIEAQFGGIARVMYDRGRRRALDEREWLAGLLEEIGRRGWDWLYVHENLGSDGPGPEAA